MNRICRLSQTFGQNIWAIFWALELELVLKSRTWLSQRSNQQGMIGGLHLWDSMNWTWGWQFGQEDNLPRKTISTWKNGWQVWITSKLSWHKTLQHTEKNCTFAVNSFGRRVYLRRFLQGKIYFNLKKMSILISYLLFRCGDVTIIFALPNGETKEKIITSEKEIEELEGSLKDSQWAFNFNIFILLLCWILWKEICFDTQTIIGGTQTQEMN